MEGRGLPYRLARRLVLAEPDLLRFDYHLANLGRDPMPYIWAAHPQFACGQNAEVILPPHVSQVCNVLPESWGWGVPEQLYAWPQVTGAEGAAVHLDRIVLLRCSVPANSTCCRTNRQHGQRSCTDPPASGCA